MKKAEPLGPWPLGIDNVSDLGDVRRSDRGRQLALRDAANVNLDRTGWPTRRPGHSLVSPMAGLRDLWKCQLGTFGAAGTSLFSIDGGALTAIADLNSADPCSYAELNDAVIVANRTTLLRVRAGQARALGVPDAPPPAVRRHDAGGLQAGRYALAVSFLFGDEEGGLSPLRVVELEDGEGIALEGLPTAQDATAVRIYRTMPRGEVLYRVTDLPVGLASYLIGASTLGPAAETQGLRRMPPGSHVAAWRGRLLVAHGPNLFASEPMAYGLFSPRHGFVQFPQRITMLAPVVGGVFVGTTAGVHFLRGSRPKEWALEQTGGKPPIPGALTYVDAGDTSLELPGQKVALWLSQSGYVAGTDAGMMLELQADRIALPPHARGSLCVHKRRVVGTVT